jgi:flagellar motor switch protein FliM
MQGMRDNKILSQAEIEALLADEVLVAEDDSEEAPGGEIAVPAEIPLNAPAVVPTSVMARPSKPAKLYDFRRPDKFSKENLRSLRILHESFARLLGQALTSYLSAGVQVRLTMLEQGTYDEYIQSLPNNPCPTRR